MNPQFHKNWVADTTDEQMIAAFHEFYLELMKIGNLGDARRVFCLEMDRRARQYRRRRKFANAALYALWNMTCGYGTSTGRWLALTVAIVLAFAVAYRAFRLIEPVTSWFDYIYFSVVTLTTLGYGDIHPLGVAGKLASSIEVVCGLIMFGMLLTLVNQRVFQK